MKYFLYFFILFLSLTSSVFAGSFEINNGNSNQEYKVSDEIIFEINLDTKDEYYNALSGEINIDDRFILKQIVTGGSIISAWIENPSETKTNQVKFSGIIAGGFKGNGTVFKIILIPKESGDLKIQINNSLIYLNDGEGTEQRVSDRDFNIPVRELYAGETNTLISLTDKIPPEKFEVILTKDKNIGDGKYILIFEATDKGSGVKTYEVLEGNNLFKQAKSPYVLVNQKINERIYVKAIDYSGNERVVRVNIEDKVCLGNKCFKEKITISILLGLFILSFILWRKQSRDFKKLSETL